MSAAPLFAFLFGSPLAAGAIVAGSAAIPVIIHLLNRRRYDIVEWAAMRFLLAVKKRESRRLRIEQLLILAVRCLILVAAMVAMAAVSPWAESIWQRLAPGKLLPGITSGRVHRIIVLDHGYAATAVRSDGSTRWEYGLKQAKQLVSEAGQGDAFSVVILSSPAQVLIAGPADDRSRVLRELDALSENHGGTDVSGGVRLAAEAASKPLGRYSRRETIFISDRRRSVWPMPRLPTDSSTSQETTTSDAWTRIQSAGKIVFVDTAGQDVDNVAVMSIALADSMPIVGLDTAVSAIIQNHGRVARTDLSVEFLISKPGDRLRFVPIGRQTVNLAPFASTVVTLPLDRTNRLKEPGNYVVQARVGRDALAVDDSRAVSFTVRDTIPVAVVNGRSARDPLASSAGFLIRALNPFPDGERSPFSPITVRELKPVEFQDAGLGDLLRPDHPAEAVFVCDPAAVGAGEVRRLDTLLQRGGCVVLSVGPQSAEQLETLNRFLFDDGKGILPGRLIAAVRAQTGERFSLQANEDSFRLPPLSGFRSEQERGGFATPTFSQYLRMEIPPNSPARRIFNFQRTGADGDRTTGDPAVVEIPRHRGKVYAILSSLNADWNDWPRTLSFAPFFQELIRHVGADSARRTIQIGQPIEEFVSPRLVGTSAEGSRSDNGESESPWQSVPIASAAEAGLIRFPMPERSGVYRIAVDRKSSSYFAVNVPTQADRGRSESDLRQFSVDAFSAALPPDSVQVVARTADIGSATSPDESPESRSENREPRGPGIARWCILLVILAAIVEGWLAWRFGSARSAVGNDQVTVRRNRLAGLLWWPVVMVGIGAGAIAIFCVAGGDPWRFLPGPWQRSLEQWLGMPAGLPGEHTRWRIEGTSTFFTDPRTDGWLTAILFGCAVGLAWMWYRRERPTSDADQPDRPGRPRRRMFVLRTTFLLILFAVLLPQVRLVFEREGMPEFVVILDDSRSCAITDRIDSGSAGEYASARAAEWAKIGSEERSRRERAVAEAERDAASAVTDPSEMEKQARNLSRLRDQLRMLNAANRVNLAKAQLLRTDDGILERLIDDRRVRVHVYRMSEQAVPIGEATEGTDRTELRQSVTSIMPDGDASRIGDGILTVLKRFRGSALNGIIVYTDGNNTRGEEMAVAARAADRAGVPLYVIGLGDSTEPLNSAVADIRAEEATAVGDRWIVDVRVQAEGKFDPQDVRVSLRDVTGNSVTEVASQTVRISPGSAPKRIRLMHQPKQVGDRTYVIESAPLSGETDTADNRVTIRLQVTEPRPVRILMIESEPRYDYRYLKSLLEREADAGSGRKLIELEVFLASAHPEAPKQDAVLINRLPGDEELSKYDLIVLGDVDFSTVDRGSAMMEAISKFVREKGGGLIMIAGSRSSPFRYRESPLADIMPVIVEPNAPLPKQEPAAEPYRPVLTAAGKTHPALQFSPEEAENERIVQGLQSQYWFATNYRRKPAAEVLMVHPEQRAQDDAKEGHPLMLQQFVGAGRVIFLGFDETWRWRLRRDEIRFNQFWLQLIRTAAGARSSRVDVRTDRRTYRTGETMRIIARFPDHLPPPEGPVDVVMQRKPLGRVDPATSESRTLRLSPKQGSRATFEAIVNQPAEGNYTISLAEAAGAVRSGRAECDVLPPPGEFDRTALNERELKRLAADAHGRYYPFERADELLDDLPEMARTVLDQPTAPIGIWNHPATVILLVWLIAAEWIMRKRRRLL